MPSVPPPAPNAANAPATGDVAAEAGMPAYRVQLPAFEGPLDLLLHLIEEHELDIRDIPIAFVAHKYVEYITLMDQLNIDVASEYLVMAATLAHIKSKMLLPVVPHDQEEDDEAELDPRAELVRRLLEYQKYKNAAEHLGSNSVLGRDVFPRGMPAPNVDGPAPLAGLSLFKLLDAFQSVLSRAKATIDHQIDFERFSITDRINELSDLLRRRPKLPFDELFQEQRTRFDLIITFLALLEMTRLRLTRLYQDGPLEIIIVELAVSDESAFAVDNEFGDLEARGAAGPSEEDEVDALDDRKRHANAGDQGLDGDDELDDENYDELEDDDDLEDEDDEFDDGNDDERDGDADQREASKGEPEPEPNVGAVSDPSETKQRGVEGGGPSEREERDEDAGDPDDALDFETER